MYINVITISKKRSTRNKNTKNTLSCLFSFWCNERLRCISPWFSKKIKQLIARIACTRNRTLCFNKIFKAWLCKIYVSELKKSKFFFSRPYLKNVRHLRLEIGKVPWSSLLALAQPTNPFEIFLIGVNCKLI